MENWILDTTAQDLIGSINEINGKSSGNTSSSQRYNLALGMFDFDLYNNIISTFLLNKTFWAALDRGYKIVDQIITGGNKMIIPLEFNYYKSSDVNSEEEVIRIISDTPLTIKVGGKYLRNYIDECSCVIECIRNSATTIQCLIEPKRITVSANTDTDILNVLDSLFVENYIDKAVFSGSTDSNEYSLLIVPNENLTINNKDFKISVDSVDNGVGMQLRFTNLEPYIDSQLKRYVRMTEYRVIGYNTGSQPQKEVLHYDMPIDTLYSSYFVEEQKLNSSATSQTISETIGDWDTFKSAVKNNTLTLTTGGENGYLWTPLMRTVLDNVVSILYNPLNLNTLTITRSSEGTFTCEKSSAN